MSSTKTLPMVFSLFVLACTSESGSRDDSLDVVDAGVSGDGTPCEPSWTRPLRIVDSTAPAVGEARITSSAAGIHFELHALAGTRIGDVYAGVGPVGNLTWGAANSQPWITGWLETVVLDIPAAAATGPCGGEIKVVVLARAMTPSGLVLISAESAGGLGPYGWYDTIPLCCGPTEECGDDICQDTESCASCAEDCGSCPVECGDGTCDAGETCASCSNDCGACCGNGSCADGETCASCAADCGTCCGNGSCAGGETCASCAADCGPCCGNGVCSGGETCAGCPSDCGVCERCGDGRCSTSESCSSCASDCGLCGPACGDGTCNVGETCSSCAADCGPCPPVCGDGTCNTGETCSSCAVDCGACCGNGTCAGSETCATCPADCGACCGNGACTGGETCTTCPMDCGPCCGNGTCSGGETCASCAADCGPCCGNGVCSNGETCVGCPSDCGACQGCVSGAIPALTTRPIPGSPFVAPIYVTQAPGRPDALFVVELAGRIKIVVGSTVSTFLDLSAVTQAVGEQGLLGLAFDPDYAASGRFFVYYTPRVFPWQNVVAEYRRSANPNVASPTEVARLWQVTDAENGHNGGCLQFGPDGFLYAATGDGGGSGDQHGTIGNALDLSSTFGKVLRFDIDAPAQMYAAAGNPFPSSPLVWAYGLRNPWRFSFDRERGHLYLADVGQFLYEEIDFRAANAPAGANFGWRAYEGNSVYDATTVSLVPVHAAPLYVIYRAAINPLLRGACAIVGGYVYRGSAIPGLRGTYVFGDNCSADIGAFHHCPSDGTLRDVTRVSGLQGRGTSLSSFGEDLAGELYITYVGSGDVLRIVAAP